MSTSQRLAPRSALNPAAQAVERGGVSPSDGVEIIHPDQYADRRSEQRSACDQHGVLLLLPANEVVSCRIIDQSASGARIVFDQVNNVASDAWLFDLTQKTARHGSAAWTTLNRMGLKFDLVQQLIPGSPRPPKVPEVVYAVWLKISGAQNPTPPAEDVVYFD